MRALTSRQLAQSGATRYALRGVQMGKTDSQRRNRATLRRVLTGYHEGRLLMIGSRNTRDDAMILVRRLGLDLKHVYWAGDGRRLMIQVRGRYVVVLDEHYLGRHLNDFGRYEIQQWIEQNGCETLLSGEFHRWVMECPLLEVMCGAAEREIVAHWRHNETMPERRKRRRMRRGGP